MSELSELFDRDPLQLTNEDISKIIARMREARAQFELGQKASVTERKKKAPAMSDAAATDLLKDLGLE